MKRRRLTSQQRLARVVRCERWVSRLLDVTGICLPWKYRLEDVETLAQLKRLLLAQPPPLQGEIADWLGVSHEHLLQIVSKWRSRQAVAMTATLGLRYQLDHRACFRGPTCENHADLWRGLVLLMGAPSVAAWWDVVRKEYETRVARQGWRSIASQVVEATRRGTAA